LYFTYTGEGSASLASFTLERWQNIYKYTKHKPFLGCIYGKKIYTLWILLKLEHIKLLTYKTKKFI
jgi:hypothetical protein